jgi:fido (protein-threonine AMPylation protein)
MPRAWNEDPPGSGGTILKNCASVLDDVIREAAARSTPTIGLAQDWHRRIYGGITLPVSYYAGGVRDSDPDFPELDGYEVAVSGMRGVPAAQVPGELASFERGAKAAVAGLDEEIAVGEKPARSAQLHGVITLCAATHSEWVRIHPFANGNGRTARLWANWAAVRYGLPPFVTIKPRPPFPAYRVAAVAGMRGDLQAAVTAFTHMLNVHLAGRMAR